MFDLNVFVSAALNAAIHQAITPLVERIEKLEAQSADKHQRLLVLEGALTDRVVALEGDISHEVQVQQANITAALAERIAALENNPAQGQDLTPTTGLTREEVREIADACIEQAMDNHLECYDHDNYDEIASKVEDHDFDEFVTSDSLDDAVRDAVGNLTFEVSVS